MVRPGLIKQHGPQRRPRRFHYASVSPEKQSQSDDLAHYTDI